VFIDNSQQIEDLVMEQVHYMVVDSLCKLDIAHANRAVINFEIIRDELMMICRDVGVVFLCSAKKSLTSLIQTWTFLTVRLRFVDSLTSKKVSFAQGLNYK
jgi:hypothetical protein